MPSILIMMSMSPLLLMIVLLSMSPIHITSTLLLLKESPSEEHPEDVIGIEIIFMELLTISLGVVLLCPMLIIKLAFFFITQTSKCLTNFLECLCCLRSFVLIRVEFQS
jgi:hypothetical protein